MDLPDAMDQEAGGDDVGPNEAPSLEPLLPEESLDLKKLDAKQFAQHVCEYAVSGINVRLLMVRVSTLSMLSDLACLMTCPLTISTTLFACTQLARDGVHSSILEFCKDIRHNCLSLAVRFSPAALCPLFPWPNAACYPAVRSERYVRAEAATCNGLGALRFWIVARSEAETKEYPCGFSRRNCATFPWRQIHCRQHCLFVAAPAMRSRDHTTPP